MKTLSLVMVALLGLALSGCAALSPLVEAVGSVGDSSGTDEGEAGAEGVLFQDDFSDPDSGWDRSAFEGGETDYYQDGYRIMVANEFAYVWANPYQDFTDVSVTVDAVKIGGADDNEFGIICRNPDLENFYVAVISSDGFYGFLKRVDGGTPELLNMENMPPSDAINQGTESNTIRLDCVGETLTLYVNGVMVASTTDSALASGDVGLYAGSFSVPGTDILFDNFVVRQP
jgi:hypothetical protein